MSGNICLGLPPTKFSYPTKVRIFLYTSVALLIGAIFIIGR